MDKMTEELEERIKGNVVAVFHADCLARGKLLFGKVIKDELVSKMQTPFSKNGVCPPWLGMYGFGEFAKLGAKNEFHNYTTALYVLYR
jgi:small ligand-binding sensory domain FIST